MAEQYLMHQLHREIVIKRPAKELVVQAFKNKEKFHASKAFLNIGTYCPW